MLTNEERERIKDQFTIYDLLEELDITMDDFIDHFDWLIEDTEEIMTRITEGLDVDDVS